GLPRPERHEAREEDEPRYPEQDRDEEEARPAEGIDEEAAQGPRHDPWQAEEAREQRELGGREAPLGQAEKQDRERARAHPPEELAEAVRGVNERAIDGALRDQPVAEVGDALEHAEHPERGAEAEPRGRRATEQRAPERRGEADGPERDPAVVAAVSHVDQE